MKNRASAEALPKFSSVASANSIENQANAEALPKFPSVASAGSNKGKEFLDNAGMAELGQNMSVHSITAAQFARRARKEEAAPGWKGNGAYYRACSQAITKAFNPLGVALSPEAAGRIYLAMVNGNGHFLVLHNLARFEELAGMKSRAGGHIVAFEGEVQDDYGLFHLLQFDKPDNKLFALDSFPPPDIQAVALFYLPGGKNNRLFLDKIIPSPPGGKRYSRLIPIPTKREAFFLDQPNLGTTFRHFVKLMHGVDGDRDLLWHCAASIIYTCGSPDPKARRPVSAMSSKWRRVAYSQATRHWATAQWEGHTAIKGADTRRKDPPAPVADGFDQVFGRAGNLATTKTVLGFQSDSMNRTA